MVGVQRIREGVSRRSLLASGLAGGFLLAFHIPECAGNEPVQAPDLVGKFAANALVRVDHSGKTTLVMPQVEMGRASTRRSR
jgi:isoquinoline 1-oxidoreductase subunit beta